MSTPSSAATRSVAGVVAGVRTGETYLQAGYMRAFERIGATVQAAGVGWDDVVDIASLHTALTTQLSAIVAVNDRYIEAPFTARTAIQVARLIPDNGIGEREMVAKLPKGATAGRGSP
jgi:enamine deaminase RidA (YjgF/YER057c/UK114 family)